MTYYQNAANPYGRHPQQPHPAHVARCASPMTLAPLAGPARVALLLRRAAVAVEAGHAADATGLIECALQRLADAGNPRTAVSHSRRVAARTCRAREAELIRGLEAKGVQL